MGLLDAIRDEQFRADVAANALDVLRGVSRGVGSTATGLVDLAALPFQLAGMTSVPVGSTRWAEDRGLIPKESKKLGGLLGEGVGAAAPTVLASRAGQIARGLLNVQANMAAPSPLNAGLRNQAGAIVWHGSPHKFDRFDASKIGTGEGAQAYGHGLYLAESPDVAMKYQPRDPKLESKIMQRYSVAERQQNYPAMQVYEDFGLNKTPDEVLSSIYDAGYSPKDLKAALEAHKIASKEYARQTSGSLYKVDLPDSAIARMLDWDKPLSQQAPEVQRALHGFAKPGMTGREIYESWAAESVAKRGPGSDHNDYAARLAKQFGLPGIRYLDGGSRGVGQGTSNFVVFPGEEGLLNILERNGVPLR